MFHAFDEDNSNSISVNELKNAMNFLGLAPTKKEVQLAMKRLDKNGMFCLILNRIVVLFNYKNDKYFRIQCSLKENKDFILFLFDLSYP